MVVVAQPEWDKTLGERKSGQYLARWASDYLMEYRVAVEQNAPALPISQHVKSWSPPWGGFLKINVDGAIFVAQKVVGLGVVFRDDKGRIEAALCRKIKAPMG